MEVLNGPSEDIYAIDIASVTVFRTLSNKTWFELSEDYHVVV